MEKVENNVKYQELIKYIKSLSDSELEEKIKESIDETYKLSVDFKEKVEAITKSLEESNDIYFKAANQVIERPYREDFLLYLLIKKDSELSHLLIKCYKTLQC